MYKEARAFIGQKLLNWGANMLLGKRDSVTGRGVDVDLTGAQNLFGTLGSAAFPILSRMGFIPTDGTGGTLTLTGESPGGDPKWIGLDTKIMQFWAYVYCSPLASVIDRLAEADTNGVMRFVDADTKVPLKNVNKSPKLLRIKKLLTRPNPWQTWEEFDGQQVVITKIFGYCPVFAIGPGFEDKSFTTALVNLNPLIATPNVDENFDIYENKPMIKSWTVTIYDKQYTIPSSDILLITDGFVGKTNEFGLPLSKIQGMDFFVSNICAAMEADNVLLKKKGPLGVFSFNPGKDMAGTTPYDPKSKDELQADLLRYGLTIGQLQYVISKLPVKWESMSYNLRDLMTKETIRQAIDGICDRFGYPAELMSGKNATYENRNSSEKWLYNNNVIPVSLRRVTKYTMFFGLEETLIVKDFSHLPVLQEDVVKAGEAERYESESLQIEWESGMITWNQWQISKGRDAVSGMDIYYPDYIKKFPQMNKQKPVNNGKDTSSKDTGAQK